MKKMFSAKRLGFRPNNVMLYPERSGRTEDLAARQGVGVCGWCGAVSFAKSWHHPEAAKKKLGEHLRSAWLGRCGACEMIANGWVEGEVIITGVSPEIATGLAGLIRSFLQRAFARDCQHRLIALHKESDTTWRIAVTDTQLANGLARRIRATFKDTTPKVSIGHEDIARVQIALHAPLAKRVVQGTHTRLASLLQPIPGLATPA